MIYRRAVCKSLKCCWDVALSGGGKNFNEVRGFENPLLNQRPGGIFAVKQFLQIFHEACWES